MVLIDIERNTQVRQRFSTNCIRLSNKIIALQTSNNQLSEKLQALIEKSQVFHDKWFDRYAGR